MIHKQVLLWSSTLRPHSRDLQSTWVRRDRDISSPAREALWYPHVVKIHLAIVDLDSISKSSAKCLSRYTAGVGGHPGPWCRLDPCHSHGPIESSPCSLYKAPNPSKPTTTSDSAMASLHSRLIRPFCSSTLLLTLGGSEGSSRAVSTITRAQSFPYQVTFSVLAQLCFFTRV